VCMGVIKGGSLQGFPPKVPNVTTAEKSPTIATTGNSPTSTSRQRCRFVGRYIPGRQTISYVRRLTPPSQSTYREFGGTQPSAGVQVVPPKPLRFSSSEPAQFHFCVPTVEALAIPRTKHLPKSHSHIGSGCGPMARSHTLWNLSHGNCNFKLSRRANASSNCCDEDQYLQ
jgi:hypothetical protein